MGVLIAYLLGILTTSKSKNHHAGHRSNSSDATQEQSPSDRPLSVVCIPPTESIEEKAKKEKKDRRETVAVVAEIVSAAILLLYFGVTILIWNANKKAADIASRQLTNPAGLWLESNTLGPRSFPSQVSL